MEAMYGAATYLCHLLITTYVATLYMCYLPTGHRWLCLHYLLEGLCDATLCLFIILRSTHHAILKLCYLYGNYTHNAQCLHQHSDCHVWPYITLESSYWWSWTMLRYVCVISYILEIFLSVTHDTMLCLGHLPDEHVRCYTLSASSFWSHLTLNYVCAMSLMMPSCLMPSYVYILSVITTDDSESVTRCECMSCYSTTVSLSWQCEQAFTLSHLSDSHVCCCC